MADIIELINKLQEIKTNIGSQDNKNNVLNNGKGHLLYLLPTFIDCLSSKELELKDKVKGILKETSLLLIGDNKI